MIQPQDTRLKKVYELQSEISGLIELFKENKSQPLLRYITGLMIERNDILKKINQIRDKQKFNS